ncbi:recombinase family protein [uncultured Gimesia sp.]|uniref:recombinase family protein n=1 Tax=uncultured Gimesia sp. TaxID=1678688 RepID=UPI003454B9BF
MFGKTTSPTSQGQRSKNIIPPELRPLYAEVAAKAIELRDQGKTHREVCEALNDLGFRTRTGKQWRHPQQIVKLLRSFEG